jgi:hypothetical protein
MRNNPMRNDQAEMVSRLVREQEAIEARGKLKHARPHTA